jgi:hypothetical protein
MAMTYKNMGDGIDSSTLMKPPPKKGGAGPSGAKSIAKTLDREAPKPDIIRPKVDPEASRQEPPTRKAIEDRAIENKGKGDVGTKSPESEQGVRRSGRSGGSTSGNEEISRFAYEVDPGGVLEQSHSNVGVWEGAAMMLYDKQLQNLNQDAWNMAEKYFDRDQDMKSEIFGERQIGKYVLVQFNMLETDAVNAQGDRIPQFWNVSYRSASISPDLTEADFKSPQEFRDFVLDRLHNSRMPASARSTRGPENGPRNIPDGWHVKPIDYMVMPPLDSQPPRKSTTAPETKARTAEQRYMDEIRGVGGRCTQ